VTFRRCDGCEFRRSRLLVDGLAYDCRRVKFCSKAETRLSEIAWYERGRAPLALEEHEELARNMNLGHQLARRHVDAMVLPRTSQEFLATVAAIHGYIFGTTGLAFAGRFRQPGEPGVEYGHGLAGQARQGFDPEQIAPELIALFERDLSDQSSFETMTKEQIARRCARFLERFFRIHPFHDGNGRVARLLIRLIARRTRRFEYELVPGHHHGRDDYIKALEHAHGVLDAREDGLPDAKDPYGPLARWLSGYLRERPQAEDLAEPDSAPSWLTIIDKDDGVGD
jgi:fido (protein-threonine AMPylation protein)